MNAEKLKKLCTSLPGVTTDIKWGSDLCYSIGNKMFCVYTLSEVPMISFKTTADTYAELIEIQGIIPAPYAARHHWVLVQNLKVFNLNEWKNYINQSYNLVFNKLPKKLQARILDS